ncbi:acylphosphatase [Alkalihalobacterium elongatum]|uniref:acylphosphatase n=1 Tax=Alkalihalobacterium elongatum TaxID=2675466 RepID=UPI001C1F8AD4|nr:acylphosphatase [Alkalihalobacterium elongatum]
MEKKAEWLPDLSNEVVEAARGHELCPYVIALEGWRRGLTLKWYSKESEKFSDIKVWYVNKPGRLFSLSSQDKTHYFFRSRGDLVTNEAVEIGADKEATKNWLTKANVAVPKGKQFSAEATNEEIINFAATIGYPLVVKPTDGSFGRGVVTNIENAEALEHALVYVRSELNFPDVIIEEHISGDDYRLYVVDDQVVGAIRRIPANVVGDGTQTIQQLIDRKNEERMKNPRLFSCLIEIDQEVREMLEKSEKSLNSVPADGETVYLREKSNISLGGDSADALDELTPEIKNTVVNAVKAVPGLTHGGIDIIIDESQPENNQAVILELNPTAQLGSLLYPMEGKGRDIPGAIIDYYFPETKSVDKTNLYFDFKSVLQPLASKTAIEVEVTKPTLGRVYAKKYVIYGEVQIVAYHQWLRKRALELNLSGVINNMTDNSIDVIVAGVNQEDVERFMEIIRQDPRNVEIREVVEETWDKSVRIGFEIQAELKELIAEINKSRKELEKIERQRQRAEQKYMKLQNSKVWRLTLPIRKVFDWVKYIKRKIS